VEVYIRFRRW